ncbi:toll-like receptor 5 [Electrophorus electricus]|uniref:TIR domain-containing protein n=1 Tax=Electrophorus electricus TaxID=8005 RepID=A0A4W4GYN4_ELEEL|nr:toll-like receptor 5 [Electrophorus electricus]
MSNQSNFTLCLYQLWICLLLAKCSSLCIIRRDGAYCSMSKLDQVPDLPHHITYVDLSLNYISEISEKSFFGLEALQVIIMQQQEIRLLLKSNAFSGLYNLTKLDLSYNHFLQLDMGTFNGLLNLQTLILTQCNLNGSILSGDYLRPLVSLEKLILYDNAINKIQPGLFFVNMSKFHLLDVSRNWINSICEADLFGFQGRHFTLLKLTDIKMHDMDVFWSKWDECGNPFKNMSMTVLDLSQNTFSVDMAVLFFRAISGTKIHSLILNKSSSMGKSVWYQNLKDPEKNTFKGLADSGVKTLDLSGARIFALKYSLFSYMRDLEQISVASNSINYIETNTFLGVPHLKMLNLSYNLLDKIYSTTFDNLPNLEILDLSYNNIRSLMPGSFKGLPNLFCLNLTENSLQHVYEMAILPNLKVLLLANNKIISLYHLSSIARNVTEIHLEFNRLQNAEHLYIIIVNFPRIEKIYIACNVFLLCEHNKNYVVSPSNSLQVLDLSVTGLHNNWSKRKCLGVFDNLHQLHTLYLQHNYMSSLPINIFKGLTSLVLLDLSFNFLTHLPNGIFPQSLRILNLAYNRLGSVDPHAFSTLTVINMYGNHFFCDCDLRGLQTWINQTNVMFFTPIENLTCEFPKQQYGIPLVQSVLCDDEKDEEIAENLRFIFFICCTALIVFSTTGAILFVCMRGYCFKLYRNAMTFVGGKKTLPGNDGFLYDAYLCFSSKDIRWVEKALLRNLDTQFSDQNIFHCCVEARDFMPGEDHLSNMHNAVWKSRKTLCVVSREFLTDGWCLEAFTLAQTKMLQEVRDVLVVLLVEDIPQYKLMKHEAIRTYIQTRKYLKWPEDNQDMEWFFSHLTQSLLKDTKVKHKKQNVETTHNVPGHETVTTV